jgi:F0F1-type ATP synthase delta subunit
VPALEFRIDSAILSGLVIRLGDKVTEGSVGDRLETLRESLI